jgi:glutamate carboxypeptidase
MPCMPEDLLLSRLLELTSFNSHTFNPAGVARAAELATGYLQALGFTVELRQTPPVTDFARNGKPLSTPLGPTVHATRPGAGKPILLNIHLDTVHPATSTFATRIEGDKLIGPGVVDAKGGLVVMLEAIRLYLLANRDPAALEVLLNPDEEIGSPGSVAALREAGRRCRAGLVFEPSHPDGALVAARKGSGTYSLLVRGRSAHAGRDLSAGRNAITAAARLLGRIDTLALPDTTLNIGVIEGGSAANVVPDVCLARINVRVTTNDAIPSLDAALRELLAAEPRQDGITFELSGGVASPPRPANSRLLELAGQCAADLGLSLPPPRDTGGACDGNKLAAVGLDLLDSLGPVGGELHSDREYVLISSLPTRAGLAARLLAELSRR